jgi:anti-sigma regulatory factor (Ser/Thr protein kinase)
VGRLDWSIRIALVWGSPRVIEESLTERASLLGHALTAELPNLRLTLSNRSENVSLVRDVLAGLAAAIELDQRALDDIKAAVTEACNNVVLHAYRRGEGPLEVELYTDTGAIVVVVRDAGVGIGTRLQSGEESGLGIGLRMIRALVDSVEFQAAGAAPGREGSAGTEVRMKFGVAGARPLEGLQGDGSFEPSATAARELGSTLAMTLAPARLAATVLPRLLSLVAVRAQLSSDCVSDAQRVAIALGRYVEQSGNGGQVSIGIRTGPHGLELRVAPVPTDVAKDLVADAGEDGQGPVIASLGAPEATGNGQTLVLRLVDRQLSTSEPAGL